MVETLREGILGVDYTAKKCPVCGYKPRIPVHRFKMLETVEGGKERPIFVQRSYYDCSVCGRKITDWADDPFQENTFGRRYTGHGAKLLWNKRKFL